MSLKRVVLVDGHALLYRSYFAFQNLTTQAGEPVQAVFGFMKAILKLQKKAQDAVIVLFDAPAQTFRHQQYEHYKAGRAETPADLPAQLSRIQDLIDLMGITRLEYAGYEADDLIATLTRQAREQHLEVLIVTTDRDAYQLLQDGVSIQDKDGKMVTPTEVEAGYGVKVEQWIDFRALTGDASDNIPGAKGIGKVTAAKLLQSYPTLGEMLAAAQDGSLKPDTVRKKLLDSLENVHFSHELSRMIDDVPVSVDFAASHQRPAHTAALQQAFRELEFYSLLKDIGDQTPKVFTPTVSMQPWQPPTGTAMYSYQLSDQGLLGYAYSDGERVYGSLGLVQPEELAGARISAINAKALVTYLGLKGISATVGDDPLLMAYVQDSSYTSPEQLCERMLSEAWPLDMGNRADISQRLWEQLPEKLSPQLQALYEQVEQPLSQVLCQMEQNGISLDSAYLQGLSAALAGQLQQLEADIYQQAGRTFNIASRDQLETVLFDELKLSVGHKTKQTGKRSTAMSALEPLREAHPMIPLLIEYRELSKLRSTYLDPLPLLVNPKTGRLHTTYQQAAVATGRLSSVQPNLQNIPIRTEIGRQIRKGFVAQPGYQLISADYSQIELRVMAHIANDANMIAAFAEGADIHRRTAAQLYGLREADINSNQRRMAKTINFGVLYGMGPHRLAGDLGISHAEAKRFIERYFAVYPNIRLYIEATLTSCREKGYVETLSGRRRYLPEIHSPNRVVREGAERMAYNMPIQGTAADIIKQAMVQLAPELTAMGARLLLQVHDELIVEAPSARAAEVAAEVKRIMEAAYPLNTPLLVDVGMGDNWFDAK